jgi:alpha-amylase
MKQQKKHPRLKQNGFNGVSYELFIRSFADSNGDGIGDINGIVSKLAYLKQLGIEAIWITPIFESPSYHKYDVINYERIDAEYGSMADFKKLVHTAHELKIKVILDFVCNHSSSLHPWFLEAKKGKRNPYREYYIWSDASEVKDSPNWYYPKDENNKIIKGQKYYAYFWSEMPDLNYDNPAVRAEMIRIAKFWIEETGIDGFRLDAAQHIYHETAVNKNVALWQEFRAALNELKKDIYLVGEVWNNYKVVGNYLSKSLTACFNFDLAIALQKAVSKEKENGIVNTVIRIRRTYAKINPNFSDATFVSNHDQNRIMSELKANEQQAKMAAALLLTLPGSPFLYYGEEIGMQGKKPDESIREPFIWDSAKTDASQTSWMLSKYNTNQVIAGAKQQIAATSSLWNHYQALLQFRAQSEFLRSGEIHKSAIKHSAICAFFRVLDEASVLVIHNLSKTEIEFEVPELESFWNQLEFSTAKNVVFSKNKILLSAYSTLVLSKQACN